MTRLRRRATLIPAVLAGAGLLLTAAATALPTRASAALLVGSWQSPVSGASVQGSVALTFSTQQSAVTFVLPNGVTQAATVSGGTASGRWDSTAVANGAATLGAQECDTSGCTTTSVTVTVANPAPPPPTTPAPTPTPSPTAGPNDYPTISPRGNPPGVMSDFVAGSTVTVTGGYSARVTYQLDGTPGDAGLVPLPYTYVIPPLPAGPHQLAVYAGYTGSPTTVYTINEAFYDFTIGGGPSTAAPQLAGLTAPSTFYPYRDGFADTFAVAFQPDKTGTARLTIRQGKKVVASADRAFSAGTGSSVSAGGGLKAGAYTWSLSYHAADGTSTSTPYKPMTADAHHAAVHTTVDSGPAASFAHSDISGHCAAAVDDHQTVQLRSVNYSCADADPVAAIADVEFHPALVPGGHDRAIAYKAVQLAVTVAPNPQETSTVVLYVGGTDQQYGGEDVDYPGPKTAAFRVPGSVLSPQHHQLQFHCATTSGIATILSVKVTFTYWVLQPLPKPAKSTRA